MAETRMAWAMRLIAITLSVAPLAAAAFTLLFHGLVSNRALLAWSGLLVATSLFSVVMSLRYRRTAAELTSVGYLAAVVLNAVVFSLPPWILGPVDAPGVALAACFPAVSLTLSVVIFAPVKLWFRIHQAIVATSSVVWALVDHGSLNSCALAATFATPSSPSPWCSTAEPTPWSTTRSRWAPATRPSSTGSTAIEPISNTPTPPWAKSTPGCAGRRPTTR
ncbi:MAG: hypothetical protein R2705_23840 [Ilumatobacteraceae bacterium]